MLNFRNIKIIVWKDLLEVKQNKSVIISLAMVPLIIMVILPLVFLILANQPGAAQSFNDPDLATFFANLPASMTAPMRGMNEIQLTLALLLGYMFAPMFLILPIMTSASIASESFAGERERKTLEALLYTPASDAELFLGKALAAFIPSILVSLLSFVLYTVVLNVGGFPLFGQIWFPFSPWYLLVFWISPGLAAFAVGLTVLISSKVQTFMGAYQTSSAMVVLVLGLVAGQAAGVLYLSNAVSFLIGFVVWLAAAILIFFAIQQFNRKSLLVQQAN